MEETPHEAEATAKEAEAAPQEEQAPSPPEAVAKAEDLLRQANLARVRGQNSVAERLLDEAVQTAPRSVVVLEAVADGLMERKQPRKAKEVYKQALALDPKNVSVERKYAELILHDAVAASFLAGGSMPDSGTMATGRAAVILNIFVPGLGQMVTGQIPKGAFMLAGFVVCTLIVTLVPNGVKGLLSLVSVHHEVDLQPVIFVPLFLALAFYLWSLFDAASGAKRMTPRKIERPLPPSDRDFEI